MKKIMLIFLITLILFIVGYFSCHNNGVQNNKVGNQSKHHLNIPESGIESMMEANTQKIMEGTDGSVVIMVGEITRKKVDITIQRNDKIVDERILNEKDKMTFDYEGKTYTIEIHNIKKPLIGEGKAEISIK